MLLLHLLVWLLLLLLLLRLRELLLLISVLYRLLALLCGQAPLLVLRNHPLQLSHLLRITAQVQAQVLQPRLSLILGLPLSLPVSALHVHPAIHPHMLRPAVAVALRSHHLRTLRVPLVLLLIGGLHILRHLLLLLLRDAPIVRVEQVGMRVVVTNPLTLSLPLLTHA